jgi:PAS domain S-box-containing protein
MIQARRPINVLILEDNDTDAELVLDELGRAGFEARARQVSNKADYLASLHDGLDLILADYSLPNFNALEALAHLQERNLDIPFIVVTGSISEEVAVTCIKRGAADYLLKDRLIRLGPAVRHALSEKRLRDSQKKTELALRQSEAFSRAILDSLTSHIAVIDRHGLIIAVNESWRQFAITNGDPLLKTTGIGCNYLEICQAGIDAGDADSIKAYEAIKIVLSGAQSQSVIDYYSITPAGEAWYTMQVMALTDGSGGAVISHADVSQKWRTDAALRESEARFSKAFNSSPVAIYIARFNDGVIVDANESFFELVGYPRSMVIGRTSIDLNIWLKRADRATALNLLNEYKSVRDQERVLVAKNNQRRDVLVSGELIEVSGEQCILLLIHDVTDRKQAEADQLRNELLRVELEKEKELRELKDRFISTLSHDFRTPLTVIQSSSDLIGPFFDRISPEKRVHYSSEIRTQVKMMLEMMDEVLVINRAQSGKLQAYPTAVDVVSLCQSIFETVQLIDTVNHQFVFSADVPQPLLFLDEKLIRHILNNLLSNAIKYSPDGGQITLNITIVNTDLAFRITDQGLGITAEDQGRLFEEFYRAKNAGEIPGTGLGLAIVKRSAEAHGGTVSVESQEGVGTMFTVCIPAHPPS